MKVYYKQAWGIFFVICGFILIALNLMLINMGSGRGVQVVVCGFLTFVGFMYLYMPYFELRSNEIVLFNLFGMEIKRYRFEKPSDLQVLDGKVYVNTNGRSRKIRLSSFMAKSDQWEEFIRKIKGDDLTNELHNI